MSDLVWVQKELGMERRSLDLTSDGILMGEHAVYTRYEIRESSHSLLRVHADFHTLQYECS